MTIGAAAGLQEAVFAALKNDGVLNALFSGVYDEAPAGSAYPYVAMGETNAREGGVKATSGAEISFDLLVWSDEPSQMQVKELMAAVETSLEEADLSLPGFDLITLRLTSATVVKQWNEAGSLYRGRMGYSAVVYEA